jgi:predicted O-methyltransferase YrrM
MADATLNPQTASGHQILAATGKKFLRPGGRTATQQLFQWANFKPGDRVLELASSFGYSAIALAQQYGVYVIGIEKNPASVARARANVAAAGLTGQVDIREGDIFRLDAIPEQFDFVLAEAILTMQSAPGKAKILASVRDRLRPGGMFLSHELLANNHEQEIHQALAQTIRVNSTPLSEAGWMTACGTAGLQVQQHRTGPMQLLNPVQMVRDEGAIGTGKILWNILTHPQLRQRILAMRQVFQQYRSDLGHIILCATRSDGQV